MAVGGACGVLVAVAGGNVAVKAAVGGRVDSTVAVAVMVWLAISVEVLGGVGEGLGVRVAAGRGVRRVAKAAVHSGGRVAKVCVGMRVAVGIDDGVGVTVGRRKGPGTSCGNAMNSPQTRQTMPVIYSIMTVSTSQTNLDDDALEAADFIGIG